MLISDIYPELKRGNVYPIGGIKLAPRWAYRLTGYERKVARRIGTTRNVECDPDSSNMSVEPMSREELEKNNWRSTGAEIAASRIFNVCWSGCADGRRRPGKPHVYDIGNCCDVRLITEWHKGLLAQTFDLDDMPILLMHYNLEARVYAALGFEFVSVIRARGVWRKKNSREGFWTLDKRLLRPNEELEQLLLDFKVAH